MAIPAINRCRDWLSEGIGWTVPVLADAIKAMCARWKVGPHGVADDAIFAKTGSGAGCIADQFRAPECTSSLPRKTTESAAGSACAACCPMPANPTAPACT